MFIAESVREKNVFQSVNIWHSNDIVSCTVFDLAVWWPGAQSARDNHLLACNLAKCSPIYKKNYWQTQQLTFLILVIDNLFTR